MATRMENIKKRQEKLSFSLKESGPDAVAVIPGPSLVYLTGLHFHLIERPVICLFPATETPVLVLPELEAAKLAGLPYDLEATTYGEDPATWPGQFSSAIEHLAVQKIGVEYLSMRMLEYRLLQSALPGAEFSDAADVIAGLRMVKDGQEIADMQKAVQIAELALAATLPQIKIGMTEKQVASVLIQELLGHGSMGALPFQPIVSGGPNGANPHASPSDRRLSSGDLLVIDFGANWNGYFSDITRTFAVGEYSTEQARVYNTVLAANQAGRTAAAPGISCGEVDAAARAVIEDVGYGEYFIHRTGHGLGMEAHEAPYIRGGNPMVLAPGMTFTIEPGIYLPDRFGVRIEDNVLITPEGLRSLTTFPRDLQVIGI